VDKATELGFTDLYNFIRNSWKRFKDFGYCKNIIVQIHTILAILCIKNEMISLILFKIKSPIRNPKSAIVLIIPCITALHELFIPKLSVSNFENGSFYLIFKHVDREVMYYVWPICGIPQPG
jgi:hypothetical protein